ncbi:unnamed protein product [Parajaminaea phylloscopi]
MAATAAQQRPPAERLRSRLAAKTFSLGQDDDGDGNDEDDCQAGNHLLCGLWLSSSSHSCAVALAQLRRLDFLILDWEHGGGHLDLKHIETCVRDVLTQSQGHTAPLVRLPSVGSVWTKWALDAGARGIIVPQINNAQEAQSVVRDARYPPLGGRSFGPSGATTTVPAHLIPPAQVPAPAMAPAYMLAYYTQVAEEILVAVQIETRQGLENVEEIAAVQGIDALFLGPVDLRLSLGLTPALDGSEAQWEEAVQRIQRAAKRSDKALCTVTDGKPESVAKWHKMGFNLVTVGSDLSLLATGAGALVQSLSGQGGGGGSSSAQ